MGGEGGVCETSLLRGRVSLIGVGKNNSDVGDNKFWATLFHPLRLTGYKPSHQNYFNGLYSPL